MGTVLIYGICSTSTVMKTTQGAHIFFFLLCCVRKTLQCVSSVWSYRAPKLDVRRLKKKSLVPSHSSCNTTDLGEIIPGISWAQSSSLSLLGFVESSMRICNAKLTMEAKELCKWSWGVRKWGKGTKKKKGGRESWFQMIMSSAFLFTLYLSPSFLFSPPPPPPSPPRPSFVHLHFIFMVQLI